MGSRVGACENAKHCNPRPDLIEQLAEEPTEVSGLKKEEAEYLCQVGY
ncbi:MAG: hypothetical protein HXX08_21275 [Chloroflexi bacterium]|uniref:Uncharacterized protein n=1 Tax=Candidatus Chlorohelix allophototropha TaxID=3003348 RepID=A0A8T7M8Q0_9CHLR|nr:hypothetical protein [Chloroflexota bacterium]WJW68330.1 hypothetical protein OZ401_003939 [Chloroflexota bacterium L227-S17]